MTGQVDSTGGFWLLLGVLLLAAPLRLLFWFGAACLVHELGHWAAIRALGGRVGRFSLTGLGAVIRPVRGRLFSYGEEGLTALAGPAASLLLALAAGLWGRWLQGGEDAYLLAGLSLTLGLFNLLPAEPLDGGRALGALLARGLGPDRGEQWMDRLARLMGGGLLLFGLWILAQTGNGLPALWGGWLLVRRRS